jgi:hypothetical protein
MLARALAAGVAPRSVVAPALAALALAAAPSSAQAQQPSGQVAVASPPAQLVAPAPSHDGGASPPPEGALPLRAEHAHANDYDDDTVVGGGPADSGPAFKEYLRLHAGPLAIEPIVLMQVQGIPYVGADASVLEGDPANRPGFRFRLARFGFEGRLFHRIPFEITAEFNSDVAGTALLHDAWFGYDRYRFLQVFVGTQDVPFSRSALTGAGDGALIERPFAVRAMAPFHQLGAMVQGHLGSGDLNYYFGVFNGLERYDQFFQGYVENSAILGNLYDGLTYAGRITSEPLGPMGRTTEDLHHGKLRVSWGASAFYSDGGSRNIAGWGGDFLLHYRGLHILGEVIANRTTPKEQPTQPTTQTATVTAYGEVVEAGYVIVQDRLGLSGRFEYLDPNTGVQNEQNSWILTVGASYHILSDFLKAQLDYTHREELYGLPLKNDSVVFQAQLNL